MAKKKTLITSALPYANGPLHFGHIAGAYLPGDCYARFKRLKGDDVLYVCGSDEYGVAITLSADIAGRTPKQQVDLFHEVNYNFFKQLNMSFDHYSRTTWEGHKEPVQKYFQELLANGYIEERMTDQLYSEREGRFLADRYVVGGCPACGFDPARGDECPKCGASYDAIDLKNPKSKITGSPLIRKKTKHWFLLLDKFKDRLSEWLETKKWKTNVVNFVKGYIRNLHARAITRDSEWGVPIPLPGTEGKVLYVWFDAPIGYISATMEWAKQLGQPEKWKEYWLDPETKLVNFIGKDNIPFHAAIFPAMTMGQNVPYKLVDELPANEFYNLEGRQFSKSEGWYIDLEDFFKKYTTDQIRYAIASNAPETSDSEFSWQDFQLRCNAELLGKYGNLVNRVMVFAGKHTNSHVPLARKLEEVDHQFLGMVRHLVKEAETAFEGFKLRKASSIVIELAQIGNVYFDNKAPWRAAKDDQNSMEATIYCCLECLKALALISSPIIPESAQKIWNMLGYTSKIESENWDEVVAKEIAPGQLLRLPEILFRRIEDEEIQEEIEKLKKLSKSKEVPVQDALEGHGLISIDDVTKLDLRIGEVMEAIPVPKSGKLLQLTVNLGADTRTIVSGIGHIYTPETIKGKKVIIVANLKPAKLMGVESQGMLLAASSGKLLEIPTVQELPPGSIVK